MAGKKRGRPKSKKRMYFDEVVQDAIVRYNTNPDNHTLRNKIGCKVKMKILMKLLNKEKHQIKKLKI